MIVEATDKTCNDCIYRMVKSKGALYCDYPVPGWMRWGCGAGGFLSTHGFEAADCPLYKTRADLAAGSSVPPQEQDK